MGKTTIGCASALAILEAVLKPESKLRILDLDKVDVQSEFVDKLEVILDMLVDSGRMRFGPIGRPTLGVYSRVPNKEVLLIHNNNDIV